MRRKNLGNRIVKKAITWAMIVMMSFSGAMSGFASMTVYAEETESNIDNRKDECDLEEERVDSSEEKYNDVETSGDQAAEEMTQKAAEAEEAAKKATDVVNNLGDTVADLKAKTEAVVDTTDEKGEVIKEGAATEAKKAADDVETKANTAETTANGAENTKKEAVDEAKAYNKKAAEDQTAINNSASQSLTDVTVETETEEGKKVEEQKDLSGFVEEKAEEAKEKEAEAKTALEDALKGESADAVVKTSSGEEKTVTELVEDANKAAEDAKKAADEAQGAVDTANDNLANAIKEYNVYAMMYGLALYGEETADYTYSDEDFTKAGITDEETIAAIKQHVADKKAIEDKKQEVLDTKLTDLTQDIADAQGKVKDAQEKAVAAAEAAEDADAAANAAKDLLTKEDKTGYADIAQKKADEAINVETTPAKDEYDTAVADADEKATKLAEAEDNKTNVDDVQNPIITQKETEKTALETDLKNVNDTIDAQNQIINNAQNTIEDLTDKGFLGMEDSKYEKATKTLAAGLGHYETYWFFGEHKYWVGNTQDDLDKAQAVVDKYNKAVSDKAAAESELASANTIKNDLDGQISSLNKDIQAAKDAKAAAQKAVDDAQAAKNAADAIAAEKKAVYDQAEADKAERLKEAEEELKKDAAESIIESLQKTLSENSNAINQVEYDKDLNAWANTMFEKYDDIDWSWKFWEGLEEALEIYDDAKDTRDWMDDEYKASKMQEIFNHLGLTQWIVSTKQREETMDALIQAYRDAMVDYEKDLATITAYKAGEDAENAVGAVDTQLKAIDGFKNSISDAQDVIDASQDKIDNAQEKYDAAVEKLEDIKEEAKNISLSGVDLAKLMAQIKKAEEEVKSTEEALKKAKAAKAAAQNYADWAEALITEHYTRSYAQALVDEKGNPILDENGKKQFSFVNGKEFDLTDKGVVSRDPKWFIEVSKGTQSKQVVPYSIYRAYVQAMYENYNYSKLSINKNNEGKGLGISTGTITETGEQIGGTMDVIYWEVDENNKLTGNQIPVDALVDGQTYFVGYTFKHEGDGYHIDGVLFTYEAPVVEPTPGPTETPEPTTPSPTPTTPSPAPTTTPGGTTPTDTPVTIPDAPVALAAAPVAADDGAAVLGARRTDGDATEAAVLGARRGTEQAVLGKRRKPQTGDTAALNAWMAAMTMAAGAAGISGTKLAKGKKKEEKED